jgi:hypothetical protein
MGVLHIRKLVFNCPVHWSREEGAMAGLISAAALNNSPELRHQAKVRVEDHEVGKYRIELILKEVNRHSCSLPSVQMSGYPIPLPQSSSSFHNAMYLSPDINWSWPIRLCNKLFYKNLLCNK